MSQPDQSTPPPPARGLRVAVALGMTMGIGAGASEASADDTTPPDQPNASDSTIRLSAVRVGGHVDAPDAGYASGNTNSEILHISRMPDRVRDTPQTITVVPQELIRQQRAFTLDQALANVPGITMSTGEGAGGLNGDQFRIRGLQARQDIYTDGLRDFGTYTRDTFNTESVEVIKGPSGEYFGAGNVGGVINQSQKHAHAGTSYSYDQSFGSGPLYRGVGDINYQINEDMAIRVNGMFNRQDVVDRNNVTSNRYGAAVDFGVGLRSRTSWHLTWQWLNSNSKPDYGVSMIQVNGIYRPITEYGVARNTSYTRSFDFDRSNIHTLTSALKSDITRWFTLTNDTRLSLYQRDYTATTPAACSGACAAAILSGGNYALPYGAGGGAAYRQEGWGVQNVLMGRARLNTGFVHHDIKAGVDINYASDSRWPGSFTNRVNDQTIRNPQYTYSGTSVSFPASGYGNANARDLGLFLADRIQLTRQLSLFGTARWDSFASTYYSNATASQGRAEQKSDRWSPSASIMYSPLRDTSFYFTFARSYKPVGTDVSSLVTIKPQAGDVAQNGVNLSPQRSDLFEFGNKSDFFHKRLGTTVSFFQISENNSRYYDVNGDMETGFADSGSGRRIRGVELSADGRITRDWQVFASYSYMDGRVTHSNTGDNGRTAPQVPHNNMSVWTSYDLSRALLRPQWGSLKVGGGAQYSSGYWAGPDTTNTARMPYTFNLNGMVSWEYRHYRVSFNANNITNRLNYASSFSGSRAVPSPGRYFLGNIGITF
ncbi:TonB-dependent outer membrane siderophore receptor [Komagataeibacter xylinus NBRC 13693]|uniref:TonB-dependent outer membrane siderophore receptor n=1 Tax=Komagataeibacter xylinus NBRC 13693 TaxID=1234668 RepID=A0A0D6Q7T8_KOMXY|nr:MULTISPECIES: TonB-dependent receptor [Komagataeibacter]GAN99035.1 TonB-dependent outer membrane siderophore receptor [Komagataeibacter xylinus NBRC 13693]GCE78713.1 hydroxamate-type ferrisiderophore receptor [Komagataeibacter oboediens]